MARVIVGAVLESITGRLGTSSFLKHKGGHSLRRTPTTRKACKGPAIQAARSNLARAAHAWSSLTSAQRARWEQYAKSLNTGQPSYDKERAGGSGNRVLISKSWGIMSGYNAFLRNNLTALSAGWPTLVTEAPINVASPLPITGLVVTCSIGVGGLFLTWTNDPPFQFNTRITASVANPTGGIATQTAMSLSAISSQGGVIYVRGTCGTVLSVVDIPGDWLVITRRVSDDGQTSSSGETVITPGVEP